MTKVGFDESNPYAANHLSSACFPIVDGEFRAPNGAVKIKLLLGVRISICIPLLFLKYHITVDRVLMLCLYRQKKML